MKAADALFGLVFILGAVGTLAGMLVPDVAFGTVHQFFIVGDVDKEGVVSLINGEPESRVWVDGVIPSVGIADHYWVEIVTRARERQRALEFLDGIDVSYSYPR